MGLKKRAASEEGILHGAGFFFPFYLSKPPTRAVILRYFEGGGGERGPKGSVLDLSSLE